MTIKNTFNRFPHRIMNKRQYEKLQKVIDGFGLEIDQNKSQQNPDFNSRVNFNKDVILITGAAVIRYFLEI